MNKMRIGLYLCSLFAVVFLAGETVAGGQKVNLTPEEGFFGVRAQIAPHYYVAVSENRLSSKPMVRRCQAVFLPSFSPESAVYLFWDAEKPDNVPVVVSVEMERSVWSELHQLIADAAPDRNAYSTGPEAQLKVLPKLQVKTKRREAQIELETAKSLDSLWQVIISQARFPEKADMGLDGESVHFASPSKGGYHTAQTWSPEKGTPAYELVEIARKLQNYPQVQEDERKTTSLSLRKMAKNLLSKIERKK
jgi:hypothetical protein